MQPFKFLAPRPGLEPGTCGLTGGKSYLYIVLNQLLTTLAMCHYQYQPILDIISIRILWHRYGTLNSVVNSIAAFLLFANGLHLSSDSRPRLTTHRHH
ncbi:hypothetical protein AAKU67_002525 [Oxalobacteraceae bacterium GrIS 2.11]